jgi:hypothetical protein
MVWKQNRLYRQKQRKDMNDMWFLTMWFLIAANICFGMVSIMLLVRIMNLEDYCKKHSDWHAAVSHSDLVQTNKENQSHASKVL